MAMNREFTYALLSNKNVSKISQTWPASKIIKESIMQENLLCNPSKNIIRNSSVVFFLLFLLLGSSCNNEDQNYITPSYKFDLKYEPVIDSILETMSLEDKINMLHGNGKFTSAGYEKAGLSEIAYTDGTTGIREELERHSWTPLKLTNDSATFFPTGTAVAATWNNDIAYSLGEGLGLEARARDKDILLAPGVNIIRTPLCGRTFEYFSEDPYLNSKIAVAYVKGIQDQDVAACVKHFIANNQELDRGKINVDMSERTLREIYLPAFKAAVIDADVYAIMGAYNKFRGEYLCQNSYLNNTLLKSEFEFNGVIISDWGATHSTVRSAMGGLDIEMGTKGSDYENNYMAAPLRDSVLAGIVPDSIIDDKVKRILRLLLNCKKNKESRQKGEINTTYIHKIAYNIASESIVLLKNENNILPLNTEDVKHIAIIGQNAVQPQSFGGITASVKAKYEILPLEGILNKTGEFVTVSYAKGYEPQYEDIPGSLTKYPMSKSNPELIDEAVELAKNADVVILMVGTNRNIETEALDRKEIVLPFGQDELIKAITAVNEKTVTVVIAGAPCDLTTIKSHSQAILYSWFNGSEAGNALADVLFGTINPSGKLPFTLPGKLEDIGAHALEAYPGKDQTVKYKEGILVGYRWLDTKEIEPVYPFGHGISYTSFKYSDIDIEIEGSGLVEVGFTLKNTGKKTGKEVVQCYIHDNESSVLRPYKELKAFQKVKLSPGKEMLIRFLIPKSELAFYDENSKNWHFEPGEYTIMVGSSSRDIRLSESIEIE
jgi:beta-glucosidase